MNRNLVFYVITLVLLVAMSACSCSGGDDSEGDVTIATDSVVQTGSFKKSNGELCDMKVTLVVSYPQAYKDSLTHAKLMDLFCSEILKAPKGTTDIKSAMKAYAQSLVSQNTP